MKNKGIVTAVILAFIFFACSVNEGQSFEMNESPASGSGYTEDLIDYATYKYKVDDKKEAVTDYADEPEESAIHQESSKSATKRKLIKNAQLSFETDSLILRKEIIDDAIMTYGGYIASEEHYASYNRENVAVTVRVPGEYFDVFMQKSTQGVGEFESRTISVNDVTEEYIDVAARIRTKKELKTRFVKLLDRAESIKKIFEIEREISALQEEIESFEARLFSLSNAVSFSTISMTYFVTIPEVVEADNAFSDAFFKGWDGIVLFLLGITHLWPFLVILILVFVALKLRKRNRRILPAK